MQKLSLKKFFKKNNKRKFAKFSLIFLLIFSLLQNNLAIILAQSPSPEITSSASPSPTEPAPDISITPSPSPVLPTEASAEAGPFVEPTPTLTPAPTTLPILPSEASTKEGLPTLEPSLGPSITPNIFSSPLSQNSATIRIPIKSLLLSARHLSARQSISVKILNAANHDLKISILRNEKEVNLEIRQKLIDEAVILTIDPPVAFAPGKYSLKVTDTTGHIEKQDFIWGVLAINTDKSVYRTGDEALLSFAVLDENGMMDCNAKLTLNIINDSAKTEEILSSENGKISVTEACKNKTTSNTADFTASYKINSGGTFNLSLTAQTAKGSYSITDSFVVENNLSFQIERNSFPTRINPSQESEVSFKITAGEDFKGQIIEAVPDVFQVASSSATPYHWIGTAVNSPKGLITGTDSPLIIRYPFEGQYPITLKYGEHLQDALEKDIYQKYGLDGHDGVDFGLPEGTPVIAVDDGEILLAGAGAYGVTVVLQHSWGRSYYGHLQGTGMALGDKVLKGAKIALSGKTGLATGPHLHFGMKFNSPDMKNGYYGKIDPLPYLQGSSIIPGFSVKLIEWQINLKKGRE